MFNKNRLGVAWMIFITLIMACVVIMGFVFHSQIIAWYKSIDSRLIYSALVGIFGGAICGTLVRVHGDILGGVIMGMLLSFGAGMLGGAECFMATITPYMLILVLLYDTDKGRELRQEF